jgi:3',5'-cyclic AMP phosphodiesterase CpdA
MPVYPIVGNRDRREPFLEAFAGMTGLSASTAFVQYAVDLGPLRIVFGDTLSPGTRFGDACEERIDALDALLGAARGAPTLLVLHHPPTEIEELWNPFQFASQEGASGLRDLVARHEHIRHVLTGHTHRADRAEIAGVPLSTAPSIATELRLDDYPKALSETPVFQIHHADDAGNLVSRTEIVQ